MKITLKSLSRIINTGLLGVVAMLPFAAQADEHAAAEASGRAMAMVVEAVVTDIDLETRHVTLQGPTGQVFTVTATEQVVKLEDVNVGDTLVATYLAALEGEMREPTEEELAEPWVVLEDAGATTNEAGEPVVGGARLIRAVTTIEGMNRALGTVTLMDSNGKLHLIGDVEPEKMEGVTLGTTIVVIYREALALSLEHTGKAAE